MKTTLQVEFSSGLLEDREAVLRRSGCRVISVLGCDAAQPINLVGNNVGVVVVGHGASQEDRQKLIALLRKSNSSLTIVCLLRSTDRPFPEAKFNLPADNPAIWERTVVQGL